MANEKQMNHEARLHGGDAHEPIPGEREQSTAMPLQHPFGEESQAVNLTDTMDEPTKDEHRKEGGGRD